jgi:hypothetical protein
VRRSCLLIVALAMLVSAAPAGAGGGAYRHAGVVAGADQGDRRGHADQAAIVPAGLAGAPLLTEWWREPLAKSTTDPTNPATNGGGCRTIVHAIALLYPFGNDCTIRQGTVLFAVAFTVECSNVEPEPFHADTPLEAALCGLRHDRLVTELTMTLDGARPVSLDDGRFGTFMVPGRVTIPPDPIFGGTPGETMRYGGHGFVAFIRPLAVGKHTLHTHVESTDEGVPPEGLDYNASIIVTR